LSEDEVRSVVRENLGDVRACYRQGLAKKPGLAGRVVIQLRVEEDGRVGASGVEASTVDFPSTEACFAEAVSRWRFPAPTGGTFAVLSYPFVLTPGKADTGSGPPERGSADKAAIITVSVIGGAAVVGVVVWLGVTAIKGLGGGLRWNFGRETVAPLPGAPSVDAPVLFRF
jgi:hypothetical protein